MRRTLFLVAINLVPAFFLWVTVTELKDAFVNPGIYPFRSEFFSPYSIYKSRGLFIAFNLFKLLALLGLIFTSIIRRWKLYYVLLAVNVILITYRMIVIQ